MKRQSYYKIGIEVTAGKGGNGCVSFRRERKVPKGGPDGGDGGVGGCIYVETAMDLLTLNDLRYHRIWKAPNGQDGGNQNRTGANGEDVCIKIPIGTEILEDDEIFLDITEPGKYLLVKGGRGGLGNQHFTSSTMQAPSIATKGSLGETRKLTLVLKYMADVGLIGMPNAGKSTLVKLLSNAPVVIGDYPFSTIDPVLGVIRDTKIVIADLPGLIDGASEDRGLGHEFLQHLARCRLLVHVLDSSDPDIMKNFATIENEVRKYDPTLLEKEYIVCLSKTDLVDNNRLNELISHFSQEHKVVTINQSDPDSLKRFVTYLDLSGNSYV